MLAPSFYAFPAQDKCAVFLLASNVLFLGPQSINACTADPTSSWQDRMAVFDKRLVDRIAVEVVLVGFEDHILYAVCTSPVCLTHKPTPTLSRLYLLLRLASSAANLSSFLLIPFSLLTSCPYLVCSQSH